MKGTIFLEKSNTINWLAENVTGDVEGTQLAMNVIQTLITEHAPVNILVDLSKAQRPTSEQRKIIIGTIQANKDRIKKIAFFGDSPLMKAVSFFIINTSGFSPIKFFSTRHQALTWLKTE